MLASAKIVPRNLLISAGCCDDHWAGAVTRQNLVDFASLVNLAALSESAQFLDEKGIAFQSNMLESLRGKFLVPRRLEGSVHDEIINKASHSLAAKRYLDLDWSSLLAKAIDDELLAGPVNSS